MIGRHQRLLEDLGIAPDRAADLDAYLAAVAEWGSAVNLTAAREPADRVAVLVAGVLPLIPLIEGTTLLDVGSGNGSPGLVLAALRPDLRVTLLEPRGRRWAFLREASRRLHRPGVTVERQRVEDHEGVADTVTVRALAADPRALARVSVPRGRLLVMGRALAPGPHWRDEEAGTEALHVYRRST